MLKDDAEDLANAIRLAYRSHAGQYRHEGKEDYINHPLRVMMAVGESLEGPERVDAMIAAVLHDVVEDSEVGLDDILFLFGSDVAGYVDAVTHRKGAETYAEFITRAQLAGPVPTEIKIRDIRDNLREPFPLGESMKLRYNKALNFLLGF